MDPEILVWNSLVNPARNSFNQASGLGEFQPWDVSVFSPRQYDSDDNNPNRCGSFMLEFARKLRAATGDRVEVILVAMGGRPIERFNSGTTRVNSDAYVQLTSRLAACGWPAGSVDMVGFCQGENNNGSTRETYETGFNKMRRELSENTTQITDSTPFYIVELAEGGADGQNPFLQMLPQREDYPFVLVEARELATVDGIHYSPASLEIIGQERLYNAFALRVPEARPTLRVAVQGADIVLTYTGTVLESSTNLSNWVVIPNATSPHTEMMSATTTFYRSR